MPTELEPPTNEDALTSEDAPTNEDVLTTEAGTTTHQGPAPDVDADVDTAPAEPAAPFPYGARTATANGAALSPPSARGVLRGTDGETTETGAVGSTACPVCGGETVDGAGLFACLECEWVGSLE